MTEHEREVILIAELRASLERMLGEHGFTARRGLVFVRRLGTQTHRVELPRARHVAASRVTFVVEDKAVTKLVPRWRAGGGLSSAAFARPNESWDLAAKSGMDSLVAMVASMLPFFALATEPAKLLDDARRRYVPGFVDPSIIAPYLAARLDATALASYVAALLRGRPELWPSFLGHRGATSVPITTSVPDHGCELAMMLARHGGDDDVGAPDDTVTSHDLSAANSRCFFGRQLRAWGEPEAAALLSRVDDARIAELRSLPAVATMTFDDPASAQVALRAATSEDRPLRRSRPQPRLFQFHVLHEPFAAMAAPVAP